MRHYDLADRTRNRFTAQVDIVPSDVWTFSVVRRRPQGRLQQQLLRPAGVDRPHLLARGRLPPAERPGRGRHATTTSATPGCSARTRGIRPTAQFNDPLRDWTADSTETVQLLLDLRHPPRIGRNTEVRFSYDFSYAEGNYLYAIPAGSPMPTPNQLPNVFNKLQQLHIDVRHRLSSRLAGVVLVPVRAAQHLRLRVRPERGQRHRAAELAGHGLRLSALHRPLGGVRHSVSLVVARNRRPAFGHMEDPACARRS